MFEEAIRHCAADILSNVLISQIEKIKTDTCTAKIENSQFVQVKKLQIKCIWVNMLSKEHREGPKTRDIQAVYTWGQYNKISWIWNNVVQ